jgi:hypothetical protein
MDRNPYGTGDYPIDDDSRTRTRQRTRSFPSLQAKNSGKIAGGIVGCLEHGDSPAGG